MTAIWQNKKTPGSSIFRAIQIHKKKEKTRETFYPRHQQVMRNRFQLKDWNEQYSPMPLIEIKTPNKIQPEIYKI